MRKNQNPFTPMMTEVFDSLIRQCMFTLPGTITAFDEATQIAQVRPDIKKVGDEVTAFTMQPIPNVPVHFTGDGEWYFYHQIVPGETTGILHFSQRAIDTWIDQGGPAEPHDRRILSQKDAFFVPGVRPIPNAIPNFTNSGAGISNYSGSVSLKLSSSGISATGDTEIDGDLSVTGALSVTGEVALGESGDPIARVGDEISVTIPSGSSAGTYTGTITTGSATNTSA